MWISAKTIMELLERIIRAEGKAAELELRVKKLEERPIVSEAVQKNKGVDEDVNASKVVEELLNGIPDEKIGRVRYTDGR